MFKQTVETVVNKTFTTAIGIVDIGRRLGVLCMTAARVVVSKAGLLALSVSDLSDTPDVIVVVMSRVTTTVGLTSKLTLIVLLVAKAAGIG